MFLRIAAFIMWGEAMYMATDFENAWKQDTIFVTQVCEELEKLEKIENECCEDATFEHAYKQKNCFCTPAD